MIGEVAGVFVTLFAAHQVADHWLQTQAQSDTKGLPGRRGRRACLVHVSTYTATALAAVLVLAAVTGWEPDSVRLTGGLLVSAVTHYVADRREPLKRLAWAIGKDKDWVERGGGLYVLDQSFHIGWLWVSALVIAG